MKLVIFPGAGGPGNPRYASVYRLLEQEANKFGYTDTDRLQWPGHENKGILTLDGALQIAHAKLDELEAGSDKYDILARSFGCYVALKIALDKKPKALRKIMLWGPPPYWLMWDMWCRDIEKQKKKAADEQGLSVDEKLFPSLVPIEWMLPQITYETVVATGTQDPYVSHAYLRFLESLVQERKSDKNCQSIKFKDAVPGAVHSVTEDSPKPVIEAYLKALFE